MNVYKIIFARNLIISCNLLIKDVDMKTGYHYEHDKGQLIYAIIKAETESDAMLKGEEIIKENIEKIFGNDFIN